MFLIIGILHRFRLIVIFPKDISLIVFDADIVAVVQQSHTFRSQNLFRHVSFATVYLAGGTEHTLVPVISIVRSKIIIDVTRQATYTAAESGCGQRTHPHEPGHDVYIMDRLIQYMVATQPLDVKPVANAILHVTPLRPFLLVPPCTLIPMGGRSNYVADHTVADIDVSLPVIPLVAALVTGDDRQARRFSHLRSRDDRPDTRRIDGTRFLHEHMLACLHGCLEMLRTEVRRRTQEYHVDIRHRHHLFVSIEAQEAVGIWYLVFIAFFQNLSTCILAIFENIGQSDNRHVRPRFQKLAGCARTPIAVSDEGGLERFAVRRDVYE